MCRFVSVALAVGLCLPMAVPAAHAQNRVVNPDFDVDASGWSLLAGNSMGWTATDANGCQPGSGGLQVASAPDDVFGSPPREIAFACPCIAVTAGETLWYAMGFQTSADGSGIALEYFSDAACAGDTSTSASLLGPTSNGVFTWLISSADIPAGIYGVKFAASGLSVALTEFDPPPPSFAITIDRVYVGSGEPISWDDFEPGGFCRWAAVATAP